jgi:hypothetical protein
MSYNWVIALAIALVVGSGFGAFAQSASADEPALAIDFAQVFADVEAAAPADGGTVDALRDLLYRTGLKMINAVPYEEWAHTQEATRLEAPPVD